MTLGRTYLPSRDTDGGVSPRLKRIVVIGVLVLAGLIAALMTVGATFLYSLGCTSGDGGVPYTAEDSLQKDVCEVTGNGFAVLVLSALVAVAAGMLAGSRGRKWRDGSATPLPFVGSVILTALSPLVVLWVAELPSDRCTGEKLAAYERWTEAGSSGEPPYRCQAYY
jgi:hypothetical protein